MKPFGKRIAMAVVCAATLTSPLLLSGCSMSELWQGSEQSRKEIAQRSEQDQVQLFNQYVKAVSRFNRMAVMFDYANTPTLNGLKAGQHLTVFNTPNFKQLQKELEHHVYPMVAEDLQVSYPKIPASYLKHFVVSNFIETLTWWLKKGKSYKEDQVVRFYLDVIEMTTKQK